MHSFSDDILIRTFVLLFLFFTPFLLSLAQCFIYNMFFFLIYTIYFLTLPLHNLLSNIFILSIFGLVFIESQNITSWKGSIRIIETCNPSSTTERLRAIQDHFPMLCISFRKSTICQKGRGQQSEMQGLCRTVHQIRQSHLAPFLISCFFHLISLSGSFLLLQGTPCWYSIIGSERKRLSFSSMLPAVFHFLFSTLSPFEQFLHLTLLPSPIHATAYLCPSNFPQPLLLFNFNFFLSFLSPSFLLNEFVNLDRSRATNRLLGLDFSGILKQDCCNFFFFFFFFFFVEQFSVHCLLAGICSAAMPRIFFCELIQYQGCIIPTQQK